MDGQLQINDEVDVFEEDKAPLQRIHTSMDPEIRQVYEKMKGLFPSFSYLEVQEPRYDAVMNAVGNLGGFSWTYSECKALDKHNRQRADIARIKVGPDARTPVRDLNVSPFASISQPLLIVP